MTYTIRTQCGESFNLEMSTQVRVTPGSRIA